ncbi:hypothetical protein EST38_g1186 [Candolleomyces aberdarensis]|uniref:Fanconi-associated nuclease n=1 Tax=Candolleomyces aberdarensis TaxID=2316362 RepID=A0A4Q2DY38_9AGAR|nr:hypothetical protein EST38_g1186 [Candolleomyces aberdarensis]
MDDSRALKRFIQLKIYGNGRIPNDQEAIEKELATLEEEEDLRRSFEGCRRPSAYVEVFETMINLVFDGPEKYLLSEKEWLPLSAVKNMSYNTRYCLVRMLLLKPDHWYPVSAFEKWKREVGPDGILPSMEPLCKPVTEFLSPESTPVKQEEAEPEEQRNIIDLTLDSDDEDVKPNLASLNNTVPVAGPSKQSEPPDDIDPFRRVLQANPKDANLDYFCEDESVMTIEELLNRMTVDQLKALAKQNKCIPKVRKPKKNDYVEGLLKNSRTQSVLGFTSTPSSKGKVKASDSLRQTQLPFAPKKSVQSYLAFPKGSKVQKSQEDRLRKQALAILGKCYRVNYDFFKLIRRVHIIAFRSTELPPKLMIPALLTHFKKRAYPDYRCQRDPDIWPSRHHLLDYEKALELEALVDEILEAELPLKGRESTVDPKNRPVAPALSTAPRTPLTTPSRTPSGNIKAEIPDPPKFHEITKEENDEDFIPDEDEDVVIDPVEETIQKQRARKIVQFLDEWILNRWEFHLDLKPENSDRPPSLQRFEPGFVYTKLLRRAAKCLATVKDYKRELAITESLLAQKKWQRGKRSKLYYRRFLIQMNYVSKADGGGWDFNILRQASEGAKQALLDEDTHLVVRPSIVKRLRILEKRMKTPPEECVQCEGELREAVVVNVKAKRIFHRASSLKLDAAGYPIKDKENASIDSFLNRPANRETPMAADEGQAESHPTTAPAPKKRKGVKTIWEGRNGEEVSVEERALQHYQGEGFKGYGYYFSVDKTYGLAHDHR